MDSKRVVFIDIMRGMGIVAMLLGHCVIPDFLHKFIYMWHMPLFFIVSGYFYKRKKIKQIIRGSFRSILLPYFLVCSIILFLLIIRGDNIMTFTLGSVGLSFIQEENHQSLYGGIGPLWFLPALFWCRVFFSIIEKNVGIKKYIMGGVIMAISSFSIYFGHKNYIPFYMGHGLAGMIFYYVGYNINKMNIWDKDNNIMMIVVSLVFVTIGMCIDELYFYTLGFPIMILNILAAVGGTNIIYLISKKVQNTNMISLVSRAGQMSILILCLHSIDYKIGITKSILNTANVSGKPFYVCFNMFLLFIPLFGSCILSKSPVVRKFFNIQKQ